MTVSSANEIRITLPDGSVRTTTRGSTGADIAASIGAGLAKAALAVKIDGELKDLDWPIPSDVRIEIVTGWLAFFIMLPLAWTSTDAAMRRLGPKWKRLQRWVYWAAILTFLHWILTAESLQRYLEPTLLSAPLIALSIWRFGFRK